MFATAEHITYTYYTAFEASMNIVIFQTPWKIKCNILIAFTSHLKKNCY